MKIFYVRLFAGRISRSNYMLGILLFLLLMGLFGVISLFMLDGKLGLNAMEYILMSAYALTALVFFFSITIRRLHDVGLSLWDIGSDFYPLQEGQDRVNKYGGPPKPGIDLKSLFGFR
jgi:uncharacterized membrane protein YhaH (DUF805 family)